MRLVKRTRHEDVYGVEV